MVAPVVAVLFTLCLLPAKGWAATLRPLLDRRGIIRNTNASGSGGGGDASAQTPVPYRPLAPLLDTPWTDKVGTDPWPQHPRPLLYRDQWQTLNGIWTFQPAGGSGDLANPPAAPLDQEVLVPSCIESGLSGIMVSGLMHMWYATKFTVPSEWLEDQRVLLNFEAVDYEATVFLNGEQVGFHRGGYFRFTMDITDNVRLDGDNEL